MGAISTFFMFVIIVGLAILTGLETHWGVTTGAMGCGLLDLILIGFVALGFMGVRDYH